jgi:hypothetical protein
MRFSFSGSVVTAGISNAQEGCRDDRPCNTRPARAARRRSRELVARYGIAIDDRDLESVAAMFNADAAFRSKDGVMNATGRFPRTS